MDTNELTITFRAKRDDGFAGRTGYKVPRLTTNHVSVKDRDMLGILFMGGLHNADITAARIKTMTPLDRLPSVVFEDSPGEWTVTPDRSGFMATVSVTVPLVRKWSE